MKIMKTLVGSDDGSIYSVDTIELEGKLWLVPHWIEVPAEGVQKPARLIRMDSLPHQSLNGGMGGKDYMLNGPVPKVLLDQPSPKQAVSGFEVRELPDVEFPLPDRSAN